MGLNFGLCEVPMFVNSSDQTSVLLLRAPALPSFFVTSERSELFHLKHPALNVLLWQRLLPPEVLESLEQLCREHGSFNRAQRLTLEAPEHWQDTLLRELPLCSTVLTWLKEDFEHLRQVFQALVQSEVTASLSLIGHDACRQFHFDYLRVRLIVTYSGPGTEWVPEEGVNRLALDHRWARAELANAHIAKPETVRQAHTGDVLLLKGAAWPENGARGAVHRSPPIREQGLRRLVFKLDTPFEAVGSG